MASDQPFLVVVLTLLAMAFMVIAAMEIGNNWYRIKRAVLRGLHSIPLPRRARPQEPGQKVSRRQQKVLTELESKAELERLQKIIEDRKQIARQSDISYHLWGLYDSHFRNSQSHTLNQFLYEGEWFDVKVLRASEQNGLNEFEFELKGARYRFVDDEERRGWSDNIKHFSLFLYDESGKCLIEVPMKVNIDKTGRKYSISSNGPEAFLPSDWIKDFINVKLKHQSLQNQEIRTQKHQERLSEIEDLKRRFGISD